MAQDPGAAADVQGVEGTPAVPRQRLDGGVGDAPDAVQRQQLQIRTAGGQRRDRRMGELYAPSQADLPQLMAGRKRCHCSICTTQHNRYLGPCCS